MAKKNDANLISLPGSRAAMEKRNAPRLAEGIYLAAITDVQAKFNEETRAFGFHWQLLVSDNPDWEFTGWDSNAPTMNMRLYTYGGKLIGGELTETDKGWALTEALEVTNAYDQVSQAFNVSEAVGELVRVVVKHEPHWQEPDKTVANVIKMLPYWVDGAKAPKITLQLEDMGEEAF